MLNGRYNLPKTVISNGILSSPLQLDVSSHMPKLDLPYPELLFRQIEERLRVDGDREVLVNADLALKNVASDHLSHQRLLLSEVIPKAMQAAKVLFHLGLKPKDVVQMCLPNTTEFFFPVFGTWLCGGIISPVDPLLKEDFCSQLIEDTEAKIVICCEANKDIIIRALKGIKRFDETKVIIMDFLAAESKHSNIYGFHSLMSTSDTLPGPPRNDFWNHSDISTLIWSSGTTGRPKGVQKNHLAFAQTIPNKQFDDKILLTSHFYHASGFELPISMAMPSRSIIYFFPASSLSQDAPLTILRAIDKFKVEFLFAGGSLIMEMCCMKKSPINLDLTSLVYATPIGTSISGNPYKSLKMFFPNLKAVPNTYSMTEFGRGIIERGISMSLTNDSLGYIVPGTFVRIVDPETNQLCGPRQVGEIHAKCSSMIPQGYFKRPEENVKLFAEDGFIRTGDLGHYDEEAMLYFDGRSKELIKFKGLHIFPKEIEDIIARLPGVKEVGVFARSDPVLMIELITALVVRREGFVLIEEEVEMAVAREVEDFKRLRGGVCFVEALPRNAVGKVVRRQFQEVYDSIVS